MRIVAGTSGKLELATPSIRRAEREWKESQESLLCRRIAGGGIYTPLAFLPWLRRSGRNYVQGPPFLHLAVASLDLWMHLIVQRPSIYAPDPWSSRSLHLEFSETHSTYPWPIIACMGLFFLGPPSKD